MSTSHLQPGQLAELRALLLAERDRLRARAGLPPAEELEVGDAQDHANEEAELERAMLVGDHDRARLAEIAAALLRMDDGSYGTCEETDEPIPFARLKLEPTARYTVEALELLEEERRRDRVSGNESDEDQTY
ncbi:MAG TPA: TraR/DksA family transcriptional regulator [Nannocystaceae bacterium]|nr:TraR/DksA family transcriptional regulator [Nannocystaceae bacterium]